MKSPLTTHPSTVAPAFLSSGEEMGRRTREYDWASTPLGAVSTWPQSLQSALSICLNSNFPIAIYWGRELVLFYNDAWSSIPGNKHPWALGKPAREVWPDIWEEIEPQFQKTFSGTPGGSKDALLPMQRHGYTEECYFDFTFTPIYGESGKVEGVFNAVIETTYRLINERRTAFLKNLAISVAGASSVTELFQWAMRYTAGVPEDVSFAFLYAYANGEAELLASTTENVLRDGKQWPFEKATTYGEAHLIQNLSEYLETIPQSFWPELPTEALLVPLHSSTGTTAHFLVCGLSARRRFDADYKLFVEGIASAIANVYNNIASLEEERKKAEALAQLDKAKTVFFSNISHEFRTPLTLILGSIEEMLKAKQSESAEQERLETTHRNALRLLRLVNNLLDFSRLEAGRVKAQYRLVDVAKFTAELASNFRSAVESAGLRFTVNTDAAIQPVYLDKEMWEKIVLNLLSNAFKYTLNGSITLSLREAGDKILLSVKDTGVGISEADLPQVFQRFYRVQNSTGRSFEGTGIGLSLVEELVHLHGGEIEARSVLGEGSEFIVSIPTGKIHLPAEQVSENDDDSAVLSAVFLEEMMPLVQSATQANGSDIKPDRPTVLVADDNADMRAYVRSLLQPEFNVVTASNGAEALDAIREKEPALVLSDVMMPVMDGIQLVKTLKQNAQTTNLPVILVSARAGEEARVEGFDTGADDYLVKPFSAAELLARVKAQIRLRESREQALKNLYNIFNEVPFAVAVLMGENLSVDFINQYNLNIWQRPKEEVLGKPLSQIFPGLYKDIEPIHRGVYESGQRYTANELPVDLIVNGKTERHWFNTIIDPLRNEYGQIIGQLATTIEVTEQLLARKKVEEARNELTQLANAMPQVVWIAEPDGEVRYYNDRVEDFAGAKKLADGNWSWEGMLHEADLDATVKAWKEAVRTGSNYQMEHRIRMKDGSFRWHLSRAFPQADAGGNVVQWFGTATDIHDLKGAEEQVRESEEKFRTLAEALPQMVWMRNLEGRVEYASSAWQTYSGIADVDTAWRTMVHPDEWTPVMGAWENAYALGRPFRYEVRLKNKAGEYRWHYAVAEPVHDNAGKVLRWIGALTDIQTQKTFAENLEIKVRERTAQLVEINQRLEEKNLDLENTQSFLQQLIDSSVEFISVLDKELRFTAINKKYEEGMGLSKKQLIGRSLFEINPAVRNTVQLESIYKALNGELIYLDKRQSVAKPDYFVDTYFIPLHIQGKTEGVIIMSRDVTEIVRSEKLLEEKNKELQRSNEDLQQFAHVASHDLKEPVRKIRTFGSRLREEYHHLLPDKARLYVEKMENAAERMYAMIDGVLLYSTLNALQQATEKVDLNKVISDIENDLEVAIQQKAATVTYTNLPVVEGSPILLYQLFYNLINNSLKFAAAGVPPAILLSSPVTPAANSSTLPHEAEYAEIVVQDNGIGFPQEQAEEIFKTFTRLNAKDKYEGTGLGLALCKKIVERHGGTITAESKQNEGARFTVKLPISQ